MFPLFEHASLNLFVDLVEVSNETFKEMMEAVLPLQREDGFWNVSLHDPDNYGGPETSGTGFFTYGLAWGVNNGYLDEGIYKPAALKGWHALADSALHEDGFLGYVQSTGKQPSDGQPVTWESVPNFEDYGLGAFLLAGSEICKLAIDDTPVERLVKTDTESIVLHKAWPNPFNPVTHIAYTLAEDASVTLTVHNINGRVIARLISDSRQNAGFHTIQWDGKDIIGKCVLSGTYLVHLQSGSHMSVQKVQFLK